jgi:hypothetical protein
MSESETLRDWMRAAYAGEESGCPPPEAYLEAGTRSPEERRKLDEHADRCPACAAERDLARLFDDPEAAALPAGDVDFVVSRLKEASPVRPPAAQVVAFPGPKAAPARQDRQDRTPFWKIAAALVLVLGGGLFFQLSRPGAPPLPPPVAAGPVRGGEIEALSPAGDVEAIPAELRWTPREGAQSYRVRLVAVDDTVLWEGTVTAPPARLPDGVAARLRRAVTYTWSVEALDASGARVAASEGVRFRARPEAEAKDAKDAKDPKDSKDGKP